MLDYDLQVVDPDDAVKAVRSGNRVYVGSNCRNPTTLTEALARRVNEVTDVEIVHLLLTGPAPCAAPGMENSFRHSAFFIDGNTRELVVNGTADYEPALLSDIPRLFTNG